MSKRAIINKKKKDLIIQYYNRGEGLSRYNYLSSRADHSYIHSITHSYDHIQTAFIFFFLFFFL